MAHAATAHELEETHHHPPYFGIFIVLGILTVLEVGVAYLFHTTWPPALLRTTLMALALPKAALVALYYMHLKYEGKLIYGVAILPLLLFMLIIGATAWDITALRHATELGF